MTSSPASMATPDLTLLSSQFKSFVTVKLDTTPTNFTIWKLQIQTLLESNHLLGHLDGTIPPPPPETTDPFSGDTIPNPSFVEWSLVDLHLRKCIFETMPSDVQLHFSGYQHAFEVWRIINDRFRARFAPGSAYQPPCQICGGMNHLAPDCYHRYDLDYVNPFHQAQDGGGDDVVVVAALI